MPNLFQSALSSNVTSNTVVYTNNDSVANGQQSILVGMTIANKTSASVLANVIIHKQSSGVNHYLVQEASIPFGGAIVPVGGDQKLTVGQNNSVMVHTSGSCDVILSILEIT